MSEELKREERRLQRETRALLRDPQATLAQLLDLAERNAAFARRLLCQK